MREIPSVGNGLGLYVCHWDRKDLLIEKIE